MRCADPQVRDVLLDWLIIACEWVRFIADTTSVTFIVSEVTHRYVEPAETAVIVQGVRREGG